MSGGRLFLDLKTSILSEPELLLEFGFDGLLYLNIINVFFEVKRSRLYSQIFNLTDCNLTNHLS